MSKVQRRVTGVNFHFNQEGELDSFRLTYDLNVMVEGEEFQKGSADHFSGEQITEKMRQRFGGLYTDLIETFSEVRGK